MKKYRNMLLSATMMAGATLFLAGCEQEEPTEVMSMKTCLETHGQEFCDNSFRVAKEINDKSAPIYNSKEDCEQAHGELTEDGNPTCEQKGDFWTNSDGDVLTPDQLATAQQQGQTVEHHNGGFSPMLWYWLGQQSNNNNNRTYGGFAPVYPTRGGGYADMNGTTFHNTGIFKATPSSVRPSSSPVRTFVSPASARVGFASASRGGGFGG